MKSILIVDDDPRIVELVKVTLWDPIRYDILVANNGREAVRLAQEEELDLILIDVVMPEMDGVEACQRIKSSPNTAAIKVVMLTGLAEERDRDRALLAGADDYLTKPFSPTVLITKMEELIGAG